LGDTFESGYDIRVFPNPTATAFINVAMVTKDVFDFEIKNVTGQLVAKGTVSNKKIDISDLKAGVYFLQVEIDQQVTSKRFIKL